MGDPTPDVINLKCQDCGTEFRLRPTKGRLPKGPVRCAQCGAQIAIPESGNAPPKAAVLRPRKNSDSSNELDGLAEALRHVPAGGTLIGAPIAVGFDREDTRLSPQTVDMQVPSEATEVDSPLTSPVKQVLGKVKPQQIHANLEETSQSVFNNTTRHPWESESSGAEVLASESTPEELDSVNPATHRKTRPNLAPNAKPKLSDLLKKVRKKRGGQPTQPMSALAPIPKPKSSEKPLENLEDALDESFDDMADEVARALKTRKLKPRSPLEPGPRKQKPPLRSDPTVESIRSTFESELGLAGERRGSGYIRIPTAEILDVLGTGTYRLQVESVVYEPVDEKGLVRLIKGGVLMGAELIADEDGDWMPVNDHPVILKLKKMMAEEAHRLLAELAQAAPAQDEDPEADLEEAFELQDLVELSEAPPPLPFVPDDRTIETGPPEDLPAPPPLVSADDDTIPSMDIPSEAGLMNTSAVDEITGVIQAERPGLFDGTSVVEEIADAVADFGPGEVAEDLAEPSEVPEAPAESLREPTADMDDSLEADFDDESIALKKSKAPIVLTLFVLLVVGVAAAFGMGLLKLPASAPVVSNNTKAPVNDPPAVATHDVGQPDSATEVAEPTPLEEAQAAYDAEFSVAHADALASLLVDAGKKDKAISILEKAVQLEGGSALQPKLDELKPPPAAPTGSQVLAASDLSDVALAKTRKHAYFTASYKGAAYQFVPARSGNLQAYRSLLAFGRLCEALKCGFEVPQIAAWSMPRAEWENIAKTNGLRISGIKFAKNEAGDAEIVEGAMQAIASGVPWPMAQSGDWRPLIDNSVLQKKPLNESLKRFSDIGPLAAEIGSDGGPLVAKSMVSLLVVDFLTNNFARIEPTGTLVKGKKFVSTDNLEAFQTRASTRVKGRFRWATRYNREQIDSLRDLTPEVMDNALFPDATRQEKTALKVFWKQRDAVLKKVDAQVKSKGEDSTFL